MLFEVFAAVSMCTIPRIQEGPWPGTACNIANVSSVPESWATLSSCWPNWKHCGPHFASTGRAWECHTYDFVHNGQKVLEGGKGWELLLVATLASLVGASPMDAELMCNLARLTIHCEPGMFTDGAFILETISVNWYSINCNTVSGMY